MHLTDVKGKVDFGIITIRDDEFAAVLDRFPAEGRVIGRRQYNLRRVPLAKGASYRVAVVCCIEQGTGEAQSAANDLLEDLSPRWLLVVGIAGGVPSSEVGLGDVILSTRIHDFSVEAVLHDKETEYALAGGPMEKVAAAFAKNLRALEPELGEWGSPEAIGVPRPEVDAAKASLYGPEDWQRRVRASLERHAARRHPVAMAGPIASSDRLIKDADRLAVWLKVARHVLAVEMEAAGVYRATHGPHVPCLAIRGISDIVGLERQPEWTKYACHTAAAFTFALLQTRPIEPVSHPATDPHARKLRSLVARYPFPRAQDVDPYHLMGVTESELARQYTRGDERPPYVMRDADAELDRALTTSDLVLLVGHSKSGKSRTAFEAALRLYPQSPLIIPADRDSLAELSRLEPPLEWAQAPAIVWLDDLQRFLGPNGFSVSVLNRLTLEPGQVKFLATMTLQRYEDYLRSASDVEKDLVHLLRRFRQVRIESVLSPSEAQRAQALYPNEPLKKLAEGLGEHLVAAHELWNKYDTAKATLPQGHALVRAAIDWRRAGLLRSIPESTLQSLAARYIRLLRLSHVDLTPRSFQEALHWARDPIALHVSLLSSTEEEDAEKHFEPFDYLIDHTDRMAMELPADAWEAILKFASPDEAIAVGVSAFQRKNLPISQKALHQAIQSGDADVKPRAMYVLGLVLQEEGKPSEAEDTYRQALTLLDEGELASWTRIALANLVHTRGEGGEAERLYRQVIASTEPEAETAVTAMANLGSLLQNQGRVSEAEPLYRRALGARQTGVSALAANNLALILEQRGEKEEARRLFQQAIDSGQVDAVPLALCNLGSLLQDEEKLDEAIPLLRQSLQFKTNPAVLKARLCLGIALIDRQEGAEAEQLLREVIDAKEPDFSPSAALVLGNFYDDQERDAEAEQVLRLAMASKHVDVAERATLLVGTFMGRRGEIGAAEPHFQAVLASGNPDFVAAASAALGYIRELQGDLPEAERLYRASLTKPQEDFEGDVRVQLGKLLLRRGETAEAIQVLMPALESSDTDVVRQARAALTRAKRSGPNPKT